MPSLRSKLLLVATGLTVCAVISKKESLRAYASSLCERLSSKPAIEADLSRDAFTTTNCDPVVLVPGHTHPTAAGLRSSGTAVANSMALYCGTRLFVLGLSASDQRKGYNGTRQWYWAKDVNTSNSMDSPEPADIRYMCDVDYYVDMPDLLVNEAKPLLLYTIVPEAAVAVCDDETSFYFDEMGRFNTIVAGGGDYEHYLWDYAGDSLLVVKRFLGIPYRVVAYAIERKQVGRHRQLILLAPIREFNGLAAILAYCLLESRELIRFDPIVGKDEKFVRFQVHSKEGTLVTTARPSSWTCATVSVAVDANIATVARLGTTKLMLPTTASWTSNDREAAAVLTDYHRVCSANAQRTVFPVQHAVRSYQYNPSAYDPDAAPKIDAFMSPFVHAAFAPVQNEAGEKQCVEGRINKLKKKEPKPSRYVEQCIEEFANFVVGKTILEPVCFEYVESKQTRPSQKLSIAKAVLNGDFRSAVLKCFIKSEAYADVKDPRNISQYNDADKLDMAMFANALADHCKQFKWYAPGKTPLEIANRVSEVCSNARYVNISDYHRMDGTITYLLRKVERVICMKAFANHRAKLNELLKTNVDNIGILPHGTKFKQGSSHGSGCSATSLFQTLRAAFTAYLAFRNKRTPGGNYLSPKEAFESIGIHLGDDGLDAELPISCHEWASERVGLLLEANVVERGDRGVNFLARYYSPEVWHGSPNSMCDLKRQLSKFHTTVRQAQGIKPEQKLVEKCLSYVVTDGCTPIIGDFCRRVLLRSPYRPAQPLGIGYYWGSYDEKVQYPNENVGGWMDSELDHNLPEFDRSVFNTWLATANTIEELLRPPLCAEIKPATPASVPVVVDSDVLDAKPDEKEPQPKNKEEKPKQPKRTRRTRRPPSKSTNKSLGRKSEEKKN